MREPGNCQEYWQHGRGWAWQNTYVWVKLVVPHCHGTTIGFTRYKWKVRAKDVIAVKMALVAALEHGKCGGEVTCKELWLREKNEMGREIINKATQIEFISVPTLNIPAKDTKYCSVRVF